MTQDEDVKPPSLKHLDEETAKKPKSDMVKFGEVHARRSQNLILKKYTSGISKTKISLLCNTIKRKPTAVIK